MKRRELSHPLQAVHAPSLHTLCLRLLIFSGSVPIGKLHQRFSSEQIGLLFVLSAQTKVGLFQAASTATETIPAPPRQL